MLALTRLRLFNELCDLMSLIDFNNTPSGNIIILMHLGPAKGDLFVRDRAQPIDVGDSHLVMTAQVPAFGLKKLQNGVQIKTLRIEEHIAGDDQDLIDGNALVEHKHGR